MLMAMIKRFNLFAYLVNLSITPRIAVRTGLQRTYWNWKRLVSLFLNPHYQFKNPIPH
jgi:hypothetical protein